MSRLPVRIRRLTRLRPTVAVVRRCAGLLGRLVAARPGPATGQPHRADLEHIVMRVLFTGGQNAVARLIGALRAGGWPLVAVERRGGLRIWSVPLPGRRAEVRIQTFASRALRTVGVSYRLLSHATLTRRQQERKRLQDVFYARYMAAGRRAYAARPARLSAPDRLVLLLGELEADVNNGGFAQYLSNKGPRRARAALAALRSVGASRTAAWLASALAPTATPKLLDRLDRQFDASPEDLPVLAMRHLDRRLHALR